MIDAIPPVDPVTLTWRGELDVRRLRAEADERRVATEPLPAEYSWLDVRVGGAS